MSFKKYWGGLAAAAMIAALSLGGCGKSSSGGSNDVAISGTLALSSGSSALMVSGLMDNSQRVADLITPATVALTDLAVYCVTFSIPPVAGTGTVGSDGSFSVTLTGAANTDFGCFILKGTSVLATMTFEDTSDSSISGGTSSSSKLSVSANASFGAITLDPDAGTCVVDKSKITVVSTTTVTSDTAWDPTGTWTVAALGSTQPTGYTDLCADHTNNCNGPAAGEVIYIKRLNGKTFTPDATCAAAVTANQSGTGSPITTCGGTTGTDDRFGVQIWANANLANTLCGGKLGFKYAEAKAFGKIDLTNSGVAEGDFTWTASTLVDGWKDPNATPRTDFLQGGKQPDCHNGSISYGGKTQFAWICHATLNANSGTGNDAYQVSLGGGCKDDSGNPVQIYGWPTCTPTHTDLGGGFFSESCAGTASPAAGGSAIHMTCTNTNGVFHDAAATSPTTYGTNQAGKFDFANVAQTTPPATCAAFSTSTDDQKLNQLRCYADYYQQHYGSGDDSSVTTCVRKIDMDYGATKPDLFVRNNGPRRPKGLHVFDLMKYSGSSAFSVTHEEEDGRGIRSGDNFVDCRTHNLFTITATKISDTKAQVEFVSTQTLVDTANPACAAAATAGSDLKVGTTRTIFILNKQ